MSKSELCHLTCRAWLLLARLCVGTHVNFVPYLRAAQEAHVLYLHYKEIEEAETLPHFYWRAA